MRAVRRVVLITQGLTRVVAPIVNSEHEVIAVIDAPPRAPRKKKKPSRIGVFLKSLFVMFGLRKPSLQKYCVSHSIRYMSMATFSNSEIGAFLRKEQVDILVVYSMSSLLSEEVFAAPKYGAINLHPSYLPEYPGPNPWFWRYLNQDERGGVTVHCIDAGEDTGDILLQQYYTVEKGVRSPHLQDLAIGDIGSRLLLKAIGQIDSLPRIRQERGSKVFRARNIKPSEHRSFIAWEHWSVEDVWHFLRGTELWLDGVDPPTGLFNGMRWEILESEKVKTLTSPSLGSVGKYKKRNVIFCRDGVIFIRVKFVLSIFVRNMLGLR